MNHETTNQSTLNKNVCNYEINQSISIQTELLCWNIHNPDHLISYPMCALLIRGSIKTYSQILILVIPPMIKASLTS